MNRPVDARFLVRPLEAVYFGPPRSFFAGEAHHGSSQFPPSCYAFQGLVRTQLLRACGPPLNLDDMSEQAKSERTDLVGGPDALPSGWSLTGPYPACLTAGKTGGWMAEPWLPVPRFLLGDDHTKPLPARRLPDTQPAASSLQRGLSLAGRPDAGAVRPIEGWLGPDNLYHALTGQGQWQDEQYQRELPPFVHWEDRPGLALDGDTARHGMLYFLRGCRFAETGGRPAGLLGWLRAELDPRMPEQALHSGLGAAGRKERPAAFMGVERLHPRIEDLWAGRHLPESVSETDAFWLVALTPVTLERPTAPVAWLAGAELESIAMLCAPALTLGGFRFATGQTRPNRAFLGAGTCWLFRLRGGDERTRAGALRALNNAHVLGDPDEARFGFGHTLVGLAPTEDRDP